MRRCLAVLAVLASTPARADGVYFTQTVGLSHAGEEFGRPLQTRAGFGARVRYLAIEAWMSSDTQLDREGALLVFVGGEPKMKSDLDSYGVTTRAIAPLRRAGTTAVEAYVRGNLGLAKARGALDGYEGPLVGAGGGFQIRGRVRALGFAWGPLFFLNRGPRVTGALFLDAGYDLVDLHRDERTIRAGFVRTTLGFAVGSTF